MSTARPPVTSSRYLMIVCRHTSAIAKFLHVIGQATEGQPGSNREPVPVLPYGLLLRALGAGSMLAIVWRLHCKGFLCFRPASGGSLSRT